MADYFNFTDRLLSDDDQEEVWEIADLTQEQEILEVQFNPQISAGVW